jgi:hypothetical protein
MLFKEWHIYIIKLLRFGFDSKFENQVIQLCVFEIFIFGQVDKNNITRYEL